MYVNLDKLLAPLRQHFVTLASQLAVQLTSQSMDRSIDWLDANKLQLRSDHFAHIEISMKFLHSHDDKMQSLGVNGHCKIVFNTLNVGLIFTHTQITVCHL